MQCRVLSTKGPHPYVLYLSKFSFFPVQWYIRRVRRVYTLKLTFRVHMLRCQWYSFCSEIHPWGVGVFRCTIHRYKFYVSFFEHIPRVLYLPTFLRLIVATIPMYKNNKILYLFNHPRKKVKKNKVELIAKLFQDY